MTLQAGELNLNFIPDLSSADVASSGPRTMAEELQKVRTSSWTSDEAKYVAQVWQSKNAQKGMGRPDLSDAPERTDQLTSISSFAESQPIRPVKRPEFSPSTDLHVSLQPLQEWEGYIVELNKSSFTARLIDISNDDQIEREEARFLLVDVPKDDQTYVEIGAVFRFVIGHRRLPDGRRLKASKIFFRRRPNHSKFDLEQARSEAKSIVEGIDWE